ncbi:MAG TPA: hypothetical protein VF472_12260 [Burkholderiaceae bacterium]
MTDMSAGIINGARRSMSPAFDAEQAFADPPGPDNDTSGLSALNASLAAQKNAAVMAAAQGLKMEGQDGPGGGDAQASAGNAAASAPAISLPISLGTAPYATVANASNPASAADVTGSAAPAGGVPGETGAATQDPSGPVGADPSDVAMLAAAGVKPNDAAPNLPASTRIQAMLEGTPLIEIDGQRMSAAGDAPVAPATAMQRQVQTLKSAQDSAIAKPAFHPQGSTTHCSEGTYYIAKAIGANTAPLGSAAGTFYNANTQAANLAQAASTPGTGWRRIDLGDAQANANEGKLVVMAWSNANGHGHTVTVRPNANNAQAATNPSVANIGPQNAVIPYHYAFGADKRPQVKVYMYAPQ